MLKISDNGEGEGLLCLQPASSQGEGLLCMLLHAASAPPIYFMSTTDILLSSFIGFIGPASRSTYINENSPAGGHGLKSAAGQGDYKHPQLPAPVVYLAEL